MLSDGYRFCDPVPFDCAGGDVGMSLNLFLSHTGQRYVVGTDEIPS